MSRVRVQSRVVESRKIINNRDHKIRQTANRNGKLQIGVWCLNYKTICIGNSMVSSRAVPRALIGGVYIHIFVLCPTDFF